VFTSGCDGCAGIGASALEALVTVAMCVFLTTERLDGSRVEALDQFFEEDRFDILVGDKLGKRGEWYRFVVVDTQFEPHVDCGVHGTS
jgi:hypothetical protein